MADYEIDKLNIKITTNAEAASKQLKTLRTSIADLAKADSGTGLKSLGDRLDKIIKVVNASNSEAVKHLDELGKSIYFITNSDNSGFTKLASSMQKFSKSIAGMETSRLKEIVDQIVRLSDAAGSGINISIRSPNTGTGKSDSIADAARADTFSEIPSSIDETYQSSMRLNSATERVSFNLEKICSLALKAGLNLTKGVGRVASTIALGPFKLLGKAIDHVAGKFQNFFRMFTKRAMYRAINAIISLITNGFKEGMQNLYMFESAFGGDFAKSMDSLSTSSLYLKNSLGAMVGPIVTALTPAIVTLVDNFVDLVNLINQTIALLSGASSWTRALKYPITYADAIGNANKKAKEFKATLLGIDEINRLNYNSSGAGSSGYTADDYSRMFKVESLEGANGLPSTLDSISSKLSNFFKPFKESWNISGEAVMSDIRTGFDKLKSLAVTLKDSFVKVWTGDSAAKLFSSVETMIGKAIGLTGSLGESLEKAWKKNSTGETILTNINRIISGIFDNVSLVFDKFKAAWDKGSTGEKIMSSLLGMVSDISDFVGDIIEDTNAFLATVDFSYLLESVAGFLGDESSGVRGLAKTIGGVFRTAWNEVLLPFFKWSVEKGVPASLDLITGAVSALNGALSMFNGDIPFMERLENLGKGILDFVSGVINSIGRLFDGTSYISTLMSWFVGPSFGSLFKDIKMGWEDIDLWRDLHWDEAATGITGNSKYKEDSGRYQENFELMQDWIQRNKNPIFKASGGLVDAGTAFIAGENGAEVVATSSQGTGVMNVGQLSAAVAQGTLEANNAQNELLREQNALLRELLKKEVSISTSSIVSGLARQNRRDGRTVIPVGV